jgi:decaprenylphospho-beta-D-erythro-pentofuranosid-2-ulose 2-reductase
MTAPAGTLLVLGGTSDIGLATARSFATRGWSIQITGRDPKILSRDIEDMTIRTGTDVSVFKLDILRTDSFETFVAGLPSLPDVVVCVIGLLGEQSRGECDLEHSTLVMRSNYEGPALLLGLFAEKFVARNRGTIIGVSSVAGDRGRASNYIYGSAKAGLTAFLSGLRNRLSNSGIKVITVKPGFVRTKMTDGMKLAPPLTVEASVVGEAIYNAVIRPKDVLYVGRRWQLIMTIIRLMPEFVFKKLRI